jgi:hypothetical protein
MRLFVLSLPLVILASQAAFAAVDSTLISMAPAGSTILAEIDVKRAASSQSGGHMLTQTIEDQGLSKLTIAIGLSVQRDARQILLIGLGQQSGPDAPHGVIAHGAFDPARIVAAGRLNGASTKRYRGVTVLLQSTGKRVAAIAFPHSGILVMGDVTTVYAVIAQHSLATKIDAVLRDQVDRIGPANDVWFATILSGSFLTQQLGDALPSILRNSEALQKIRQSSGGLKFGPDDQVTLDLVAGSPGDARLISDLLRFGGSLAHLQIGGNPGLLLAESVLRSMHVNSDGSKVHATSVMPDSQLERALVSSN